MPSVSLVFILDVQVEQEERYWAIHTDRTVVETPKAGKVANKEWISVAAALVAGAAALVGATWLLATRRGGGGSGSGGGGGGGGSGSTNTGGVSGLVPNL